MANESNIKSLILKGFSSDEIIKLTKTSKKAIKEVLNELDSKSMRERSEDFYTDLQRDLSRLVLTEMGKDNRDTASILKALKLQADLQDKKVGLTIDTSKLSKDYLYDRDEKIKEVCEKEGIESAMKEFNLSKLSIEQSLDRASLEFQGKRQLAPSIISETIGLPIKARVKVLNEALNNALSRHQVRKLVTDIKNNQH